MDNTTTTTINEKNEKCIDWCNKLLRGERSAVETYDMAIEKFGDDPQLGELRRIRGEHARSVADLDHNIREMGGTPADDSGAWGVFAKSVMGAAKLFGEESAVEALKKGEEKGRGDYEDALASGDLTPPCSARYADTLLPRVQRHIGTLDKLEEAID